MLMPHVTPQSTGTAHPESASKTIARGHRALEHRIRHARRQQQGSTTLYERGIVTNAGIDYQQRMMPVLYGPDRLNADMN